ncbi:MAG: PstS family phosphate ABC transporter substrate-binding protein [Deltaproteobacteria bacterium]|nr:PstS family phosphate ABC transporter substrate-binding protein [Deltaproteobacteria bacterium]
MAACLLATAACSDSSKAPEAKNVSPAAPAPAPASNNITVKGSDTMVVLGQRWAETYMKEHPDVTIQVTGGGSGTGIAALLNGTTNLANSSRPIKAEEMQKAKEQGKDIQEFKVAFDGLAVVVNHNSPLQNLTLQQLMGIYTGHFNNWKEVGGPDQKILRYCREANSGTYVFFKEHVLVDRDYAPDCQTMPGTGAVAEAVSKDPNGIGYGGVSYFENRPELKVLAIKKDDASEAISPVGADGKPNASQIRSLQYPISRNLFVYTLGASSPEIKAYVDWMLSDLGQKVVTEVGYVTLKDQGSATANAVK